MPDTNEHLYRGRVEAWTFRLRVPVLVLYTVVAGAVFGAGGTENSDVAVLTVPSFAFACLVGYLFPTVALLLPMVAFAGGIATTAAFHTYENESAGLNFIGGLVISELCITSGVWNRRRRQRAIEVWHARNNQN